MPQYVVDAAKEVMKVLRMVHNLRQEDAEDLLLSLYL